jgi:YqjK-like protein
VKTHMRELAERRQALVAEAQRQRTLATEAAAGIRQGLAFTERAAAFLHRFRNKPVVVGVAATAIGLLVARPRKAMKWLGYGLTAYSLVRRLRGVRAATTPGG